jgi:hypothetical protein
MLYMGDFIQFLGLTYDLCRKYCRGASLEKPGNKITTSALMSVARSIFFSIPLFLRTFTLICSKTKKYLKQVKNLRLCNLEILLSFCHQCSLDCDLPL